MILLETQLTSWADRWAIAGMSVLTVFLILLILVAILGVFNAVSKLTFAKKQIEAVTPVTEATEIEKAAVATALWLHFHSQHDLESGILTIHNDHNKLHIQ